MSLQPPFCLSHRQPLLRSLSREDFGSFALDSDADLPDTAELSEVDNALDASRAGGSEDGVENDLDLPMDPGPYPVRRTRATGAAIALEDSHREVVLDCLGSMALAARHRELLPLRQRAGEERRILALSDALFVTPGFSESVVAFWKDVGSDKEPWKCWAVAFVLACLEGDDIPEALASWSATWQEDDDESPTVAADALAVSPRPDRALIARSLGESSHPSTAALGIETRARSEGLPPEEIVSALQKRPATLVRLALLRAAARAAPSKDVDRAVRDEVLHVDGKRHAYEVLRALALRGRAEARELLHDRLFRKRLGPLALRALALVGDREDAQEASIAREVASHAGLTSEVLAGLGYYGHPGAAPLLIRCLGDADSAEEAERALHWIFGAPRGADARMSPEAWRAYLARASFLPQARYRFGSLYRPGLLSTVAESQPTSYRELRWLLDETTARVGAPAPVAPGGWGDVDVHALAFSGYDAAFLSDPWAVLQADAGRA